VNIFVLCFFIFIYSVCNFSILIVICLFLHHCFYFCFNVLLRLLVLTLYNVVQKLQRCAAAVGGGGYEHEPFTDRHSAAAAENHANHSQSKTSRVHTDDQSEVKLVQLSLLSKSHVSDLVAVLHSEVRRFLLL